MGQDLFEQFLWHSAIGIDSSLAQNKRFVSRMPFTARTRGMFVAGEGNVLIHRTTRALWKLSKDKKTIEPVFDTDILGEDEVKAAMSEEV
jgi:hypothetical protein